MLNEKYCKDCDIRFSGSDGCPSCDNGDCEEIDEDTGEVKFICYHCKHHNEHESCVGASCHCTCPLPDERERRRKRKEILDRLTQEERDILGLSE